MSASAILGGIVQAAIKPVADVLSKRVDRKIAKDGLQAKAILARQEREAQVTLTTAEWEVVMASQQSSTWKDEAALIIGAAPYVMTFGGAIWYGITGDYRMLEGTFAGINALSAVGVDVGFILTAVLLAAGGLSVWRWMSR